MNRRFLISLCIVGAFAFACGPLSRSDASTALLTVFRQSRAAVVPAHSAAHADKGSRAADAPRLTAQFNVTAQPGEALFVLDVTNEGGKRAEVNFPNGRTYEFVVLDSAGREVWRWGTGRIFTQTMRNKLLGRGESMRISERWHASRPGKYTAVATLRSSNYPVEQRVDFQAK
jgi:hypothetical protein